jgi:hypothetical protein
MFKSAFRTKVKFNREVSGAHRRAAGKIEGPNIDKVDTKHCGSHDIRRKYHTYQVVNASRL